MHARCCEIIMSTVVDMVSVAELRSFRSEIRADLKFGSIPESCVVLISTPLLEGRD